MKLEVRHYALLGSVAVASMLSYSAWALHTQLKAKTAAQQSINTQASGFREQVAQLKPVEGQWSRSFRKLDAETDILSLYKAIQLESLAPFSPDEMLVTAVAQETLNSAPLPLHRLCITNSPEAFLIREPTVGQAIDKISAIAARPDIRFKRIKVEPDRGALKISVDAICVLLRT